MTWIISSLRRLREGATPTVALAGIVLVTAFLFAATPRYLARTADGILRAEVEAAPVDVRSVLLTEERRIPADASSPLGPVVTEGDALDARLPHEVASVVAERSYVVDSARWSVTSAVRFPSTIRLRFQEGILDHVRIVAGAQPGGPELAAPDPGSDGKAPTQTIPVALAASAARTLGVEVGDRIELALDPTDRLALGRSGKVALEVAAVFEPVDSADPYWFADPSPLRSIVRELGPNVAFEDVTALLGPASYPTLLAITDAGAVPFRYSWRHVVGPERLEADRADATAAALRRLETIFAAPGGRGVERGPTVRTGLLPVVDAFRARWASSSAVLSVAALGAAAVALLALGLVAALAARRRRFALALSGSRGASTIQLVGSVAAEGVVVGLPAAVLGAILAAGAVVAGPPGSSMMLAAGVAVLTAVLLVAFSRGGSAADDDPSRVGPRRTGRRRLTAEALVALLAVVGAVLLRQRGVVASTAAGGPGVDPLIVAVPTLVGLAAGLVAVRLFPVPIRAFARLAATQRDLVPVLAMRRITRGGTSGPVLVVLLATSTTTAFASATVIHLDRAADIAAWQTVGASASVVRAPSDATGTSAGSILPLPDGFDPAAIAGVTRAAEARRADVRLFPRNNLVQMLAVEAAAYEDVAGDTPADPRLPVEFFDPPDGALPAIVSTRLPATSVSLRVGDTFQATIEGAARDLRVVDVRDSFPTLDGREPFMVVAADQLHAAIGGAGAPWTEAFLRVSDAALPDVRVALSAAGRDLRMAVPGEVAAELRASPFVGAIGSGIALAAAVAAAYAALGVAVALALTGAARAVEVAQLRAIGLSRRQAVGLIVLEHGPTLAVAFAAGIALGIGLFLLLRPGLGLDTIVPAPLAVPIGIEPVHLGLILAAMVLIVTVGVILAAVVQQRAVLALALRRRVE